MFPKTHFAFASCVYAIAGVLLFLPSMTVHADFSPFPEMEKDKLFELTSISTASVKIEYEDVLLSDISDSLDGDLAKAKITIPSGIAIDEGVGIIDHVKGYLTVDVLEEEIWVDNRNTFFTSITGESSLLEKVLKENGVQKIAKGVFQSSKNFPVLIGTGVVKNVSISGESSPGSASEIYEIFVFDPSADQTLVISLIAPKESSKITKQIWQKLLKSMTGTQKKDTKSSKKEDKDGMLSGSTYNNAFFSFKAPKAWTVSDEDKYQVIFLSQNLGASIGIGTESLGSQIDYDPNLYSFWVDTFLEEYEQQFDDFSFKSSKKVTIDGLPGFRIDFTATFDGVPMDEYQMITVKNGVAYILTAAALDKNQWKKHGDVISKSFATFKRK